MGIPTPPVVHVDTGLGWRGGQQQVAWLHQGLLAEGWASFLVCPPGSALSEWCAVQEIPCTEMWLGGEWNIAAGFRLARLCCQRGVRILHAHSSHALGLAHWARFFEPSVRIVATRRLDFHVGTNPLSRWKYCSRHVNAVVCVSDGVRRVLLADGVPEDKLSVIHDGVDLSRFSGATAPPEALKHLPPGAVVVGTIAALVGHKDYPTLLKAAREVVERCDNVFFCALGEGAERNRLLRLHTELGLGERFLFAGFQSDPGPWLRRFDIFVLSSREEGMGSSLLDAMALGIPIAATRAGGIPDVVSEGVNGLLVPVGDSHALALSIERLVRDPALRQTLGREGKTIAERFSMTRVVEEYQKLYQEICRNTVA